MSLTDWPDIAALASPVPQHTPDVTVSLPPFEVLLRRWNEIEPMLAKSTLRTGCYEPVDLLLMAARGEAGIWLCMRGETIDAVLVSQITVYPRRRVLEMLFGGGGNMRAWREAAIEAIDKHAIALKCSHIACCGRPGWARAWGGYPTGDIIMVRDV